MALVPSSPVTPSRRRRSLPLSSSELPSEFSPSPYMSTTTDGTTFSQRTSRTSQTSYQPPSPITPRLMSSRSSRRQSFQHRRKSSGRLSIGSNISIDQNDGGLGNLADELENAFDDDYYDQGNSFLDDLREDGTGSPSIATQSPHDGQNFGHEIEPLTPDRSHKSLQAPISEGVLHKMSNGQKGQHRRQDSKYDGSDYGPESDEDDEGLPPVLLKRIRDIEKITRLSTNTEDTLSEGGGVITRTIHALQDLGPQGSIENSLSRIITAYTSMATHRTHKTRDLFSQAHSLLYGNMSNVSEEIIDMVLSDLDELMSAIPVRQQQNSLLSLQILASQTLDLAQTLRSLTDVIQESRISTNLAARKLKSVREMVEEMHVEQELVETSIMLIHAGDWDRRCRERMAAATCREVVQGFGEAWGLEMEDKPWTRERTHVTI